MFSTLALFLIPTFATVLPTMAAINKFVKDIRELRELWGAILDWLPWKRRSRRYPIGFHVAIEAGEVTLRRGRGH